MIKKIAVVTGASGFIGKNVVKELLKKNYFVYAISTNNKSLDEIKCDNLKNIVLFFEEYPAMLEQIEERGIDLFIHCAWQGVWGKAFEDYELQMKNASYAGKAIEIAHQLNSKKFVLLSTANVLETKKIIMNPFCFNKLRATTNYGLAKISAEIICRTLALKYDLAFNCAYISMVYGEENYSMMVPNVVISKLVKKQSPDLIEGNGLYDLVYVRDVSAGLVAIGEKGVSMKSYYLGNRKLKTFKSIFSEIGKIINPDVELNFGVYPDANFIDYSLIDLNELYDDTGFEPTYDFKESILNTASWIKDNLL